MKRLFSTSEIVELTIMAAYCSGSAQIMRALGVHLEKEADPIGYGEVLSERWCRYRSGERHFSRSRIAAVNVNALRRGSH
jgi:hypothetical protein